MNRGFAVSLIALLIASTALMAYAQGGPMTQQWLNQHIAIWKPPQNGTLISGALLGRASYGTYKDLGVQQANLDMLDSLGLSCIRIDLNYAPWLQNDQASISRMNSITTSIKNAGKCLIIADASSESYRGSPIPWNQFKQAWIQRVTTLAALYKPSYYVVVKEPGWYYPMISDASYNALVYDANDWGNLTSSLATAVKSSSPNTKVGVAVSAFVLYNDPYTPQGQDSVNVKFLKHAELASTLDFIGFDIYGTLDFDGTQQFLNQAGNGGKAVWIAEAWSADPPMSPANPQLDKQWILALYYFAQYIHAQAIAPFYTEFFASYNTPPSDSAGLVQFYQQRTPVFYEFQKIIAGNAANKTSTTTTSASTISTSTTSSSTVSSVTSTASVGTTGSQSASSSNRTTSPSLANSQSQSFTTLLVVVLVLGLAVILVRRLRSRGK